MADETVRGWRHVWRAAQAVPLLPVAGLYLIVRGQWLWFEHLDTVRPGGVPVLVGIGLLLISMRKGAPGLAALPPLREGVHAGRLLGRRTLLAVLGLGVCVYTGLRAVEETLSAYEEAVRRGAKIVAFTSGGELAKRARAAHVTTYMLPTGFQPRAAIAHLYGREDLTPEVLERIADGVTRFTLGGIAAMSRPPGTPLAGQATGTPPGQPADKKPRPA